MVTTFGESSAGVHEAPMNAQTSAQPANLHPIPIDRVDTDKPGVSMRSVAEDLFQPQSRRDFQLIVAARLRMAVRAPALEVRRVTEARSLEIVVTDLRDAL